MSSTSTRRPVNDKIVIDDDMDSDTVESNLTLKSRSFLNSVNDRLRKMLDRSPEDSMQDIDKRSMIWRMFMSSTLEASVFIRKNNSDKPMMNLVMGQSRCIDDDQVRRKRTPSLPSRESIVSRNAQKKGGGNCLYTSVPMVIRLKLFFAQSFC